MNSSKGSCCRKQYFWKQKSNQAKEYRNLAEAVINNQNFVIPTPMTQDRLEEILYDYGFAENPDNYNI